MTHSFRPDRQKLALLALTFGHFAVDVQSSGIALLLPLLRAQLGLDYAAAAAIVTAQNLTSSVIQPLFGMLSDRRPVREVLPVACLLAALGTALVLLMPGYASVVAVVMVTGLGSAAFHAMASLNANYLSGAKKASGVSTFFAGGQMGYAVGPLFIVALMKLFGPRGTLGTLVPGILGAAAITAFLPSYVKGTAWQARQARGPAGAGRITRSRGKTVYFMTVVVALISVRSIIQTGLVTFIPLYFPDNKDYAALLLSLYVFAGALGTLFGGALADRFNRKAVLGISLGSVTPLLYVFLNSRGPLQVISLALSGASIIAASALTVVMAQELLPHNIGLASGLTLGLGFGAGGIGAALLGEVGDAHGLLTTLHIITLLPIVLVALCSLLPGRAPRPAPEVAVPASAGVAEH